MINCKYAPVENRLWIWQWDSKTGDILKQVNINKAISLSLVGLKLRDTVNLPSTAIMIPKVRAIKILKYCCSLTKLTHRLLSITKSPFYRWLLGGSNQFAVPESACRRYSYCYFLHSVDVSTISSLSPRTMSFQVHHRPHLTTMPHLAVPIIIKPRKTHNRILWPMIGCHCCFTSCSTKAFSRSGWK